MALVYLYIDNNLTEESGGSPYSINSSSASFGSSEYTYNGTGQFLGFSFTENSSTPESILSVGSNGTINDIMNAWISFGDNDDPHLYSVTSSSSSTITSLAGTVWQFGDTLPYFYDLNNAQSLFNINFISNNETFIGIWDGHMSDRANGYKKTDNSILFLTSKTNTNWIGNEAYKTIEIINVDTTQTNESIVISWLQSCATLLYVPPSYSAADPLVIRYKGQIIYSTSSTEAITLAVSGKYLEDDITVTLNPPFTKQDSSTLNIYGAYSTTKSGTVLTLT